jgi:hypothetical protein
MAATFGHGSAISLVAVPEFSTRQAPARRSHFTRWSIHSELSMLSTCGIDVVPSTCSWSSLVSR